MQLYDLEARVFHRQRAAALRTAVNRLSPRARLVIIARFGLDGAAPRTYDQTACELAKLEGQNPPLSRERMRQIEHKALRDLAKPAAGLHAVAERKLGFDAAAFMAHQQALQERRQAAEQWAARQERLAARPWTKPAPPPAPWAPPPAPWVPPPADAVRVLADCRPAPPSNHYDWMQRRDDLAQWRAGGRPVNPFDWMKS